ncbi:tetratricopeptide repeat protein [Variovorax sp. PAMC26660]|uniref:tetratricopeptide repeat protein n=1 Tax=Variovorax sp. PAMC26660 TaxID=2762322 RepID=UPI00164D0A44|nr:tetratricopeptide repeat protein [Variovorax sp. PAMC26660]QNK66991.1 tetratricopeptide repeat protein [Variovorax sp. PAMC26660]
MSLEGDMAVLIEAVCAVVRRDAIEERIPGGWAAFAAAVPTGAFCFDDELASVGFMAVADAETFLVHMQSLGLRVTSGAGEVDACLIEQLGRSGAPAPWLATTRMSLDEIGGEVAVAFLKGTREQRIVMPGGWKFQGSVSQKPLDFVRTDASRLEFIRSQGNVEVYWDKEQQCEVYVGRPYGTQPSGGRALSDAQRDEHNRVWDQARGIADKHKIYALVPPFKPGFLVAREMRKAIALLEKVLALHPGNAAALWMQGKFLQLLGEFDASLDCLSKAYLIDPGNTAHSREAGISATEAGKLDVAVFYAQEALKATPGDAGLRTNLAVAHLFAGNMAAARKEIDTARSAEPDDPITRSVWVLVREVAAGRMRRPTRTSEIDTKALREASANV